MKEGSGDGTSGDGGENLQYFYHPDHLGSTSYITDASGEVYRHLALFEIKPVDFNGEPTYGVLGFAISVLMAPIMAFVTAISTWLFLVLGNFVMRLFLKKKK